MDKNYMIKKAYSKPNVQLVNFSLAGSVAATCVHQGTNADGNTCGYFDKDWLVYATDGICDYPIDIEFCYHVPTEDTSIFGS